MTRTPFTLVLLVAASLVMPRTAEAYLDANTGSILLQLLVGGVAGIALFGKLFWYRIKKALGLQESEHDDG
jgi:hypothetical protein